MDAQAGSESIEQLRQDSLSIPGALGVETLWVRKSGLEYLADIHLEVDPDISIRYSHEISHVLSSELLMKHTCLRDILVHLEPIEDQAT